MGMGDGVFEMISQGDLSTKFPDSEDNPTDLDLLREMAKGRSKGRCEWPGCADPGEHLAHLTHRGMGGSLEANRLSNVAWLCIRHHDCLDGRTALGTLAWELNEMMRTVIHE